MVPTTYNFLIGITATGDAELRSRALSWLKPGMAIARDGSCKFLSYSVAERTYTFQMIKEHSAYFSLSPSPGVPISKPAFVFRGWNDAKKSVAVKTDQVALNESEFRYGFERGEKDLVLLLDRTVDSLSTVTVFQKG